MHRSLNPLKKANDAKLIGTDGIGIEEVVAKILSFMGNAD
jgi:cytidylate kinase